MPKKTLHKQRAYCLCHITVFLVFAILAVLLFFVLWQSLTPKKLHYSIVRASIADYNFTTDGRLNTDIHLTLRANNPNRVASYYHDWINMTVSYEDVQLSSGLIAPFYQTRRNATELRVELGVKGVAMNQSTAGDLKRNQTETGEVNLKVKIMEGIRVKIGDFKVHRAPTVMCNPVIVPFASSGKRFEKVPCHVDHDF